MPRSSTPRSEAFGAQTGAAGKRRSAAIDDTITPDRLIARLNGTTIFESGTLVNDEEDRQLTDVVAAWNAVNDPDLTEGVGWIPSLAAEVDPTGRVPSTVQSQAGPLPWRH